MSHSLGAQHTEVCHVWLVLKGKEENIFIFWLGRTHLKMLLPYSREWGPCGLLRSLWKGHQNILLKIRGRVATGNTVSSNF